MIDYMVDRSTWQERSDGCKRRPRRKNARDSIAGYLAAQVSGSPVEMKFEIIGEALNRIKKESPEYFKKISDYRDIISFRNILIHGYHSIDDRIVWSIIEENLDRLLEDVDELLD